MKKFNQLAKKMTSYLSTIKTKVPVAIKFRNFFFFFAENRLGAERDKFSKFLTGVLEYHLPSMG